MGRGPTMAGTGSSAADSLYGEIPSCQQWPATATGDPWPSELLPGIRVLEQYRLGRETRLRLFLLLCLDLLENSGLVVLRAGVFLYEEPQYYTVLVKRRYLDSVLSSSKIRFATIF